MEGRIRYAYKTRGRHKLNNDDVWERDHVRQDVYVQHKGFLRAFEYLIWGIVSEKTFEKTGMHARQPVFFIAREDEKWRR